MATTFNPSPSEMKASALATGTTVYNDGVTVSPEGQFFICGRKVTLNDCIVYFGTRRIRRERGEID